jgi:hypothetical protein
MKINPPVSFISREEEKLGKGGDARININRRLVRGRMWREHATAAYEVCVTSIFCSSGVHA